MPEHQGNKITTLPQEMEWHDWHRGSIVVLSTLFFPPFRQP